jgi:hypothetical protein
MPFDEKLEEEEEDLISYYDSPTKNSKTRYQNITRFRTQQFKEVTGAAAEEEANEKGKSESELLDFYRTRCHEFQEERQKNFERIAHIEVSEIHKRN